jgi:hypothetical protein
MPVLVLWTALTPEKPTFPEPVMVGIPITNNLAADITLPFLLPWCGYGPK